MREETDTKGDCEETVYQREMLFATFILWEYHKTYQFVEKI